MAEKESKEEIKYPKVYTACPQCGGDRRWGRDMAPHQNGAPVKGIIQDVMPLQSPSLLAGGTIQALIVYTDACMDCGCRFVASVDKQYVAMQDPRARAAKLPFGKM